jgi:hypothetical protein
VFSACQLGPLHEIVPSPVDIFIYHMHVATSVEMSKERLPFVVVFYKFIANFRLLSDFGFNEF